jgi:hypothetical protein
MIEINLIPDIKRELLKTQSILAKVIFSSIIIGSVSIAVVVMLAIYVFPIQIARGDDADNKIKTGDKMLSNVVDLPKTLTIQNQLTKITNYNNSKKIDSRILDMLAVIIPPEPNAIKISSLLVDSDAGNIQIEGQALNSYAAVEVFKKTLVGAMVEYKDVDTNVQNKTLASDVSTGNTSYGQNSDGEKVLRFTISFAYLPELLSPISTAVRVYIPNLGNVTDSRLGIPTDIFVDRATDLEGGK